eukprot:1977300-Rhodomonas_salina.1
MRCWARLARGRDAVSAGCGDPSTKRKYCCYECASINVNIHNDTFTDSAGGERVTLEVVSVIKSSRAYQGRY